MLLELHVVLLLSPFLMPKQEVHSLKDTCLSLSASHSWKNREVQCSMGTSGTRSGANSEWDKNLQDRPTLIIEVCCYLVQSDSLFSLVWYSSICFFFTFCLLLGNGKFTVTQIILTCFRTLTWTCESLMLTQKVQSECYQRSKC